MVILKKYIFAIINHNLFSPRKTYMILIIIKKQFSIINHTFSPKKNYMMIIIKKKLFAIINLTLISLFAKPTW